MGLVKLSRVGGIIIIISEGVWRDLSNLLKELVGLVKISKGEGRLSQMFCWSE